MKDELKRAVEAAKAHPERLEKNPGNYSTYRRFLATHGDALLAQADENERLRTQLAESEAAGAAYRAALERALAHQIANPGTEYEFTTLHRATPEWVETARHALDSNPGKAVGDVIAALEPLFGSGNALSNLAFNISQPGWPKLRPDELPKIRKLADDWDAARRATRAALAKLEGRE